MSEKADEFINYIVSVALPEIDVDSYSTKSNLSVADFATKKAEEFCQVTRPSGVDLSF